MGSTITNGRKAGAIRANDGRIYYALFERTYESNCYPHDPDWGCIGFGTGPDMVRRIFDMGGVTCGGMLRGPGRDLTPWGYIGSWLREMSQPHVLNDFKTAYDLVEKDRAGYYEVTSKSLDRCEQDLRAAGYGHIVDTLRSAKRYEFQLGRDAGALAQRGFIPPYRMFHFFGKGGTPAPELGWKPDKAKKAPEYVLPGVYRWCDRESIVMDNDGLLKIGPWAYAVEGRFVSNYAELELQAPGHYHAALKACHRHLKDLPAIPNSVLIEIDPELTKEEYQEKNATKAWEAMGRKRLPLWAISDQTRGNLRYCGDAVRIIRLDDAESQASQGDLSQIGQLALGI